MNDTTPISESAKKAALELGCEPNEIECLPEARALRIIQDAIDTEVAIQAKETAKWQDAYDTMKAIHNLSGYASRPSEYAQIEAYYAELKQSGVMD